MGSERPRGSLWIVGTPIGNLEDLSPRALETLSRADAIFCEDTRVTAKIASRFSISAARISCPAPRESARVPDLLRRLEAGETVALVSDAGMPAVSDPGQGLVAAAAGAGFPVFVVPGPSAVSAALALSGLRAVPHTFLGFLPSRAGERRRLLETRSGSPDTLVWFESPHRISDSLAEAAAVLGPRRAVVAREITKLHEEVVRGSLSELAATFAARGTGRGEMTVVVEGSVGSRPVSADEDLDSAIREALAQGTDKRSIARDLAARCGRPAREIYARAVALAADEG